MNIVQGLSDFEALSIGDKFIVALPSGGYGRKFRVNGIDIQSNGQVVVDSLEDILEVFKPNKVLESWLWEDKGISLTIKEHNDLSSKYMEFYDNDLEEYAFGSVEEEIEYIKHRDYMKNFKPVYGETLEAPKAVFITLIGSFEDTGSCYIQTPFQHGLARFQGGSGVYKVLTSGVAADAVAKYIHNNPEIKITNSNHSNIKFLQVDGKYIFTDTQEQHFEKSGVCKVVQTLDEAQNIERDIRDKVKRTLDLHCKPVAVNEVQMLDFVKVLQGFRKSLQSLEIKQKSYAAHRSLYFSVSKEIEKYSREGI